jgi:hypothetical protein
MKISSHSILASVALVALCSLLVAAQDTSSNETISGSRDAKGNSLRNCIISDFGLHEFYVNPISEIQNWIEKKNDFLNREISQNIDKNK